MPPFLAKARHLIPASLLVAAALPLTIGTAGAGGFTACESPFIFDGSAANIVPIEYLATTADQKSADPDRRRQIQETAQHLAWLMKLDSWHQPTYGSLGVVSHMFLEGTCDPDVVLDRLIRGGASAPIRPGQVLVMLQGRIFTEGEDIFLQSRLRGFRRNAVPPGEAPTLSGYFEVEGLTATLGNGSAALTATLPLLDITFAPRAVTRSELQEIDSIFVEASIVRAEPSLSSRGSPLRFEPGQPHAFTVEIFDGGKWLKVADIFGGISGYIRADPEVSAFLHRKLPELDFLNGMLGYLRIRQARSGLGDYPPPPESAARQAEERLTRFIERDEDARAADARALAAALIGSLAADGEDWRGARARFAEAAAASPYGPAYRTLLGVADARLCCAAAPAPGFDDPARSFTDSLSLDPENLVALRNLDTFLASLARLAEINAVPAGIDASRLAQRREVVQKVLSNVKEPQNR